MGKDYSASPKGLHAVTNIPAIMNNKQGIQ